LAKFKVRTWIVVAGIVPVMVWQCFVWPVEESRGRWFVDEVELAQADEHGLFAERPPTSGEVVARGVACIASLLAGLALAQLLRPKG